MIQIPLTLDAHAGPLKVMAVVDLDTSQIVEFIVGGKSLTRDSDPRFVTLCEMAQGPKHAAKIKLILRDENLRESFKG